MPKFVVSKVDGSTPPLFELLVRYFFGKTKFWFEKQAGRFPAIKNCSVSLRIILTILFKDKTRRPVAEIATGRTVMTEGLCGGGRATGGCGRGG